MSFPTRLRLRYFEQSMFKRAKPIMGTSRACSHSQSMFVAYASSLLILQRRDLPDWHLLKSLREIYNRIFNKDVLPWSEVAFLCKSYITLCDNAYCTSCYSSSYRLNRNWNYNSTSELWIIFLLLLKRRYNRLQTFVQTPV